MFLLILCCSANGVAQNLVFEDQTISLIKSGDDEVINLLIGNGFKSAKLTKWNLNQLDTLMIQTLMLESKDCNLILDHLRSINSNKNLNQNIEGRLKMDDALAFYSTNASFIEKLDSLEFVYDYIVQINDRTSFDTLSLISLNNYIGQLFLQNQYYYKAKYYFEKISKLKKNDFSSNYLLVDLGLKSENLETLSKQIDQLIKFAEERNLSFWRDKLFLKKSNYHLLRNEIDSSISSLNQVSSYLKTVYPEQFYTRMSHHYKTTNDLKKQLKYSLQALEAIREKPDLYPNSINSEIELAKVYFEIFDYEESDKYWQSAIQQCYLLSGDTKIYLNELEYIECLIGISKIELIKGNISIANKKLSLARTLIGSRFQELEFQSDKIQLLQLYHKLICVVFDNREALLYPDIELFKLSESAKAYALLDEIRINEHLKKHLDEARLTEIKNLKTELVQLEEEIKNIYGSEEKDSLQFKVSSKTLIQEKLFELFKISDMRHGEIDEIRNLDFSKIDRNQTVIEYFVSDSSAAAFVINSDSITLYDLPLPADFEFKVLHFQQCISSSDSTKSEFFEMNSHYIFKHLIAPFYDQLKSEVMIIPHGLLSSISFDALLDNNGNYLIKNHDIFYEYSLALLSEMSNHEKRQVQFLGFAPYFNSDQQLSSRGKEFSNLPFAKKEVQAVSNYFSKSKTYYDQEATKEHFIEEVEKASIVHISSHADINQFDTDFSYIAFSYNEVEIENNLLYLNRLYTLDINADMIVLSACNTGMGKHKNGEGILSLARGFVYAGTASVISTLWEVNDGSTSKLMTGFYKELANGSPKHIALAEAKRNYINQAVGFEKHPYFWAGFVAIGDMQALDFGKTNYWWFALLLLIPLGFFLFKSKFSKHAT